MDRFREIRVLAVLVAILAAFIAVPLFAPNYSKFEGRYEATVTGSASGAGLAARTVQRFHVTLEDGRTWWIGVPSTEPAIEGRQVLVEIYCEADNAAVCQAQFIPAPDQ
ncbi:MAG: hypothetical protein AAGK23_01460 [Pseudomonadota bacterium]